jgi:Immunoglobulin I-set domain
VNLRTNTFLCFNPKNMSLMNMSSLMFSVVIGLFPCVTEDLTKAKELPPEFRAQMRDITISVGEPATFDCQVSGQPKPDVYWTKDGRRIGESPRWKLIVEDDHYTMLIYEVHPEDSGVYECVVINKMGKATCSARLNVAGESLAGGQSIN